MNEPTLESAPPAKAWRWPLFLVGLLVMGVITQVVLIVVAVSDPRQHVEADYYAKALAWDAQLAEERASADLGWTVGWTLRPVATGARILELDVRDAGGGALAGADVRCRARHRAALHQVLTADCSETAPGIYAGAFSMRREGFWELALEVVRGEQRYVVTRVIDTREPQ